MKKGYIPQKYKATLPFERLQIDFGFVRISYTVKANDNSPLLSSKYGYNAYFLIIDEFTRYTWIFPTVGKKPPIEIVR